MKKSRYLQHDKTEKIYTSSRQEGTFLYITSRGDDIINQKRGKGSQLILDNTVDKRTYKVIETQFIDNIFLKDGFIIWENAVLGDTISLELVLPAGVLFPADNGDGNFNVVNSVPELITQSQTPDSTWTGTHYMFPIDVTLFRYVNEFALLGTNHSGLILESSDTAEIQKELKIKFILNSPSQSDIRAIINIEAYREFTL